MKKNILIILILGLSLSSFSQDNCNCEQALNQLIERVESDYPGLKEKTTNEIIYRNLKEGLKIKSQNIPESDCFELLRTYLKYFRDGHITLIRTNAEEVGQAKEMVSKANAKTEISIEDFYKHISNSSDELEGVWKSGSYKVGLLKSDNEYQGFIVIINHFIN